MNEEGPQIESRISAVNYPRWIKEDNAYMFYVNEEDVYFFEEFIVRLEDEAKELSQIISSQKLSDIKSRDFSGVPSVKGGDNADNYLPHKTNIIRFAAVQIRMATDILNKLDENSNP